MSLSKNRLSRMNRLAAFAAANAAKSVEAPSTPNVVGITSAVITPAAITPVEMVALLQPSAAFAGEPSLPPVPTGVVAAPRSEAPCVLSATRFSFVQRAPTSNTPAGTYPTKFPANWLTNPNYIFRIKDAGIRILPSTPLVTWDALAPINFGDPLTEKQLGAAVDLPGTYTYSHAEGDILDAGTHTLTVTFTPTDIRNYTTATATVDLVVKPSAATCSCPVHKVTTYNNPLDQDQLDA